MCYDKKMQGEENEIRIRINKALYGRPVDVFGAFVSLMKYVIWLERHGERDFAYYMELIANGYEARARCLRP